MADSPPTVLSAAVSLAVAETASETASKPHMSSLECVEQFCTAMSTIVQEAEAELAEFHDLRQMRGKRAQELEQLIQGARTLRMIANNDNADTLKSLVFACTTFRNGAYWPSVERLRICFNVSHVRCQQHKLRTHTRRAICARAITDAARSMSAWTALLKATGLNTV